MWLAFPFISSLIQPRNTCQQHCQSKNRCRFQEKVDMVQKFMSSLQIWELYYENNRCSSGSNRIVQEAVQNGTCRFWSTLATSLLIWLSKKCFKEVSYLVQTLQGVSNKPKDVMKLSLQIYKAVVNPF